MSIAVSLWTRVNITATVRVASGLDRAYLRKHMLLQARQREQRLDRITANGPLPLNVHLVEELVVVLLLVL